MAAKDEKDLYDTLNTATDVPAEEEPYSLEEILTEYGGGLEQMLAPDEAMAEALAETAEETAKTPPSPPSPPAQTEGESEAAREARLHGEVQSRLLAQAVDLEKLERQLPRSPRPITLEEVVGGTVDAVMEERRNGPSRRRGLFSRRVLEDTVEPPPRIVKRMPERTAEKRPEKKIEKGPEPDPEKTREAPAEKPLTRADGSVEPPTEKPAEKTAEKAPTPKRAVPAAPKRTAAEEQTFPHPRREAEPAAYEAEEYEEYEEEEPDLYEAAEDRREEYRRRRRPLAAAAVAALAPTVLLLAERYGAVPWGEERVLTLFPLACLAITALLCREVIFAAFTARRFTAPLLSALSAAAAALDSVVRLAGAGRSDTPSYAAAACLSLVFAQWGLARESRGWYDTFRTASLDEEPPYLVTDTEQGACKQRGTAAGFYTAAVADGLAERWQMLLLPVILAASVVFAVLSSFGQGRRGDLFLNWSVILAAGGTFALPLCWALPWSGLARRLQKTGCAVAGWTGAERISRRRRMVLTDADLFPPGTVELNGIKVYGEEMGKVISYAASMARAAGCGLERMFDELLRSELGRYEPVEQFSFYEEGGYSAVIHGESVLLGTASFLRKMEVRLPGDIHLQTGVFLAVDRQLAAVFAVKYQAAENVDYALRMMHDNRITPILASRDPNITPALLQRKFHKSVKVEYPGLADRVALSEAGQNRDTPRALLFREGLLPYAETVAGSRRLCRTVRRATFLGLLGSGAGTMLAFYLTMQAKYGLLTPLTLELFLLLWTLPVLLMSDGAGRY